MDGIVRHVEVEGFAGFLRGCANVFYAFERFLCEGFGEEGVVFVVVVFIEAADVEVVVAVLLASAVVSGAADFRAGDVVVEAEVFGVGSRSVTAAEVGFAAMDGGVALFLSSSGNAVISV